MSGYWKGNNIVGRALRFMNIVEPGGDLVLSLSKIFMWAAGAAFIWVEVKHSENAVAVASAVATLGAALASYGYRRKKMYESGRDPYKESDNDEGHCEDVRHPDGDGNHPESERRTDGH